MAKGSTNKTMTKSELVNAIVESTELPKKDVRTVLESIVDVGHKELKKKGIFVVPGFTKIVVVKKPATKERKGINPFTKEPMIIKAKPARKVLRARPVKAAKDAVL
jgi:nucleoid DNA-binding protein